MIRLKAGIAGSGFFDLLATATGGTALGLALDGSNAADVILEALASIPPKVVRALLASLTVTALDCDPSNIPFIVKATVQ